jgi:glycosyltransferase involved in cell wall biosynthesis
MTAPWVTAIVPTRRRPAFLVEALDSVRRQTFSGWRCIVAVDGDDPETIGILTALETEEPRIAHLVVRDGGSAARVRNAALERAETPCVAFLDDDDVWLDDKLARQHEVFAAHPSTVLSCGQIRLFDGAQGVWPAHPLPEVFDVELLSDGNHVATSTVVARTGAVRDVGGFDPRFAPAEDYDLWLSLAAAGEVRYLAVPLCRYRFHDGGVSRDEGAMLRSIELLLTRHHRRGLMPSPVFRKRLREIRDRRVMLAGSRMQRCRLWLERRAAAFRLSLADAARSIRTRSAGAARGRDPHRR